jgi:hypothetical protein
VNFAPATIKKDGIYQGGNELKKKGEDKGIIGEEKQFFWWFTAVILVQGWCADDDKCA